jgi:uncharacterized membrane protein (DUF373 family)
MLIGIELLETIKAYLLEKVVHVEIVIEVALIAIARKVINNKKYTESAWKLWSSRGSEDIWEHTAARA